MHEWALAQSVIYNVIEYQKKNNFKEITEFTVKMGELQQIDTEIFKFALKEITQTEKMTKMKMNIKMEDAVLRCRVCGYKWNLDKSTNKLDKFKLESIHFIPDIAHVYLRCPKCKSPDFEIIKGRGVLISFIKGVK